MNLSPWIFSNTPQYRITRHVLFWICWIFYYVIVMTLPWLGRFPFSRVFPEALIEECVSIPMDMIFCYSIIYFLIPNYLRKGKYISMVLLWLLFSVLFIACFQTYTIYGIPAIRGAFGIPTHQHSMSSTWDYFYLFSQINMEGCIAASIKLGKMWSVKQQELDLLKNERKKIEHTIQNGIIQPVFLLHALDKVERLSVEKPDVIPGMIQKIKKLMLYVIYDNNQPKVLLEKELDLLKEYIELEKVGSQDGLRISMKMPDNINGNKIAPFIILPIVENSFRQLALFDLPVKFIDVEINVSAGNFSMDIAWSKPVDTSTLANGSNAFLHTINKRLNLLYPRSHKLKVVIKADQFVVHLKIDLDAAIN